MKRIIGAFLVLTALASAAYGQSFTGRLGAGQVLGNPTAAERTGTAASLTAMFDRAFCSTANNALARVGGSWVCLATANNGVWVTSSGGVPSISSTLPNAVQNNITRLSPTNCIGGVKTSSAGVISCVALTPEASGAVCDNSTDNTAAFGSLATAINSAVSAVVEFSPNCTYRVFPTLTGGVVTQLMTLTGLNSLTVNCNGSTIASMSSFPVAATSAFIWVIGSSSNVTFNDCKFTQPSYTTRDFTKGTQYISFTATNNVIVNNMTTTGGIGAIRCTRGVGATRSSDYTITNLRIDTTYYGINAIKCPDNLTATGVTAVNPGRSYYPYNVWNHRVQIHSNACTDSQDVLIANNYDAADTNPQFNTTRHISVDYENTNQPGCTGTGPNAFVQLQYVTESGSAQGQNEISNIDLNINVRTTQAATAPLFRISRGAVTGAHSRILSNVTVRGSYFTTATSPNIMELMTDSDWTGEAVSNLSIRNFWCNGFGTPVVLVDGRGITGPFTIENAWGSGACSYTRTNMTTADAAGLVYYNRVFLPGAITTPFGSIGRLQQATSTFTANGTYTPTSGMLYVIVRACGAGGGGGGGAATGAAEVAFAGGGGAGGYSEKVFVAATVGASQAVTIGALGAGGAAGANNGTAGGNTTFGALLTATGGAGGNGAANVTNASFNNGGLGGTGVIEAVATAANPGFAAFGLVSFSNGVSGAGGSSPFGGGGRGVFANSGGQAATGRCSGGGGAARGTSAASAAGGDGTGGFLVVTEFLP